MNTKVAFLILHYMNADVTMNCIDSILDMMSQENPEIIVVDNASRNGSYEALTEKYGEDKRIHFLTNEENLGYARGNNVGFLYAKNTLGAGWICLANNDVVFSDALWMKKVTELYQKSPFYVLGPDIVTPDGVHQNPFHNSVSTKKSVVKSLFHDEVVYILLKLGLQRKLRSKMNIKTNQNDTDWKESKEDFKGVLHGSCLLFSPDYVKEFDGLYGGTFLYAEEEILCYILNRLGYRYTYCSEVQVMHCHATSFKKSIQDEDKRKMVIVKNRIKSGYKLLKIVFSGKEVGRYLKEKSK